MNFEKRNGYARTCSINDLKEGKGLVSHETTIIDNDVYVRLTGKERKW